MKSLQEYAFITFMDILINNNIIGESIQLKKDISNIMKVIEFQENLVNSDTLAIMSYPEYKSIRKDINTSFHICYKHAHNTYIKIKKSLELYAENIKHIHLNQIPAMVLILDRYHDLFKEINAKRLNIKRKN